MKPERYDTHHLLHDRVSWSAHSEGEYIRECLLAHNMARTVHNLLHATTAPVPVPNIHTLQFVANRMPYGLDVFKSIDQYSSLVEQSNRNPKSKPIERQLGLLSIQAVREQIPLIKEGLSTRRIVT